MSAIDKVFFNLSFTLTMRNLFDLRERASLEMVVSLLCTVKVKRPRSLLFQTNPSESSSKKADEKNSSDRDPRLMKFTLLSTEGVY